VNPGDWEKSAGLFLVQVFAICAGEPSEERIALLMSDVAVHRDCYMQ